MTTFLFFVLAHAVLTNSASLQSQGWSINTGDSSAASPFYYFWSQCVGSGHASLMLREDWQKYMKQGVDEIGFKYVRGHAILDDDVGSVNGINDYSFINIDKIYESLLSINISPFVEISFMPDAFALNSSIFIDHYKDNVSPPKDYNIWYSFIQEWIQHLVDIFGINQVSKWNFEVWNEPDSKRWAGNPKYDTYLELYNATSRAIKSVHETLKVGGPTLCCIDPLWLNNFLNYTLSNNIAIDFVSFHAYPKTDHTIDDYVNGIQSEIDIIEAYNTKYNVQLPVYVSEYACKCCKTQAAYDNNYASAFLVYTAMFFQDRLFPKQDESTFKWMSYWAISDVFEEDGFDSNEFGGRYGLQTIRGIAKPSFRAMQLLNKFGGNLSYDANIMTQNVENNTVLVYCLRNDYNKENKNRFSVFVVNFNSEQLAIKPYNMNIYVKNEMQLKKVAMYRIDTNHTNPVSVWKNMSSPTYPTQQQLQQINDSSKLIAINNVNWKTLNATVVEINFVIPIYGVVLLDLQY